MHTRMRAATASGSVSFTEASLLSAAVDTGPANTEMARKAAELAERFIGRQPFSGIRFDSLLTIQPTGQALVFKGEAKRQPVAIKVFLAEDTATMQRMREQEVSALRAVGAHDHIVQLLDDRSDPWPVMVMPLLSPLEWRGRAMAGVVVLQYAKQLASALEFMHRRGYAHLDVKADNMLLDSRGRVMLNDLGFAAPYTGRDEIETKGTPPFMALECFRDIGHPSCRSKVDVYAFAMTIWQMLTGKAPWEELFHCDLMTYVDNLVAKLEADEHPQVSPRWSPQIVTVMRRCWGRDPSSRVTMAEASRMLR